MVRPPERHCNTRASAPGLAKGGRKRERQGFDLSDRRVRRAPSWDLPSADVYALRVHIHDSPTSDVKKALEVNDGDAIVGHHGPPISTGYPKV